MPQLRSFTGFAATPNVGSSFVGGANVAAKIIEANQQLQLGREKIAADQQQAAMEASIKQQQIQSDSMRKAQEIEISKAYQDAQLGLKQRELDQSQGLLDLKAKEAAQTFTATQMYQDEANKSIASGVDPEKAYMQAALKFGPAMGLPSGAYSKIFEGQDQGGPSLGSMQEIPGVPPTVAKSFVSGKGSRQYVATPPEAGDSGAPPGYIQYGKRLLPEREPLEVANMRKELAVLQKQQEADSKAFVGTLAARAEAGEKLKPGQMKQVEEFNKRKSQIDEVKSKIEGFSGKSQQGQFKNGQRVRNRKTGEYGTWQNGEIVPD